MQRLDKSGFTRHRHRLTETLLGLFATFGQALKTLPTDSRYLIASFPVAVCHNVRIRGNKLLGPEADRGYCARKGSWFYGFKVQIVATTDGVSVEFYVHAGAEADSTGLRAMAPDLPEGSVLYTDAAYGDAVWEALFAEATGNQQQSARKQNSKRPHHPART
jgi:hypothetical protein